MRGYYALIGDKPYELNTLSLTKKSPIVGEENSHIELTHGEKTAVTVSVTISDLLRSTPTNKVGADMFKQFLQDNKVTEIPKLSKHYTTYIEYYLQDEICGETVDHGCGIKESTAATFLFPLGITSENEYVSRLGLTVPAKITQKYRPKHPYGMMSPCFDRCQPMFKFVIKRIWITQILERAWSVSPVKDPRPNYYGFYTCGCKEKIGPGFIGSGKKDWGRPYHMTDPNKYDHECVRPTHPSCSDVSYIPMDSVADPKDTVVIYDSADFCDTVYSAAIPYQPSSITMDVTFKSLMPALINKDEVDQVLADIQQAIDDEKNKPIEPENPGAEPDVPIDGDDKDNTDEPDPPTPPVTNPDDDVEDQPIAGDDKDVTETPDSPETGGTESGDNSGDSEKTEGETGPTTDGKEENDTGETQ